VPRHEFLAAELRSHAYDDLPLPIGGGQTISQPYIVAAMTAALHLQPGDRVLEIGTGCGYQAAVLSHLAREVFSIERRPELASSAAAKLAQLGYSNAHVHCGDGTLGLPELASSACARLARLGYSNAHVHCGDGTLGLPEFAPFDAILVAAAAPAIPRPLLAQLAEGGRMILPLGGVEHQELQLIEKHGDAFPTKMLEGCRFVPLVGYHGWQEPS